MHFECNNRQFGQQIKYFSQPLQTSSCFRVHFEAKVNVPETMLSLVLLFERALKANIWPNMVEDYLLFCKPFKHVSKAKT